MHQFTAVGAVREGWRLFLKRPLFLIGAAVVIALIGWLIGVVSAVAGAVIGTNAVGALAQLVLSAIGQTLLGVGTIAFLLRAHDHIEQVRLIDLWHPHNFWNYLAVTILVTLAIVFTFALVVLVGGLILAGLYTAGGVLSVLGLITFFVLACIVLTPVTYLVFAPYFIVDKGALPLGAMRASIKIAKEHFWQLFLLLVLIIGVNVLGFLVLVVGLLLSSMIAGLSLACAYRTFVHPGHSHKEEA